LLPHQETDQDSTLIINGVGLRRMPYNINDAIGVGTYRLVSYVRYETVQTRVWYMGIMVTNSSCIIEKLTLVVVNQAY